MLRWLRTCCNDTSKEVYKGTLTYAIAGKSVPVHIADKTHFTYAYDHMLIAQQEHPESTMKIQFEGTYKNKKVILSYSSFEQFLSSIKPLLDFSHSRLRYTK